jgi:hypothetical protein
VRSVAYVTTTFPTLAAFVESEVHRLVQRGVRVSVYTLRAVGTEYQPEHEALVGMTRAVGSPLALSSWAALLGWLVRRPHVLVPSVLRMLWASRRDPYALAGHLGYLPAAAAVAREVERERIEWGHGAWAHFPGSVAWLAARLTGRRFSLAAHAGADLYRTQAFLADKVRAAEFVSACVRGNADMLRAPGRRRVEWTTRRRPATFRRPWACARRGAAARVRRSAVAAQGVRRRDQGTRRPEDARPRPAPDHRR